MAESERRERLPDEDIEALEVESVHVTSSAIKDYRKGRPNATAREARDAIRKLLDEAVQDKTLYETPTGYVRARVGRRVSVMLSADLEVVVALHDDGNEKNGKRRKRVAGSADELREMLDPQKVHIGEAALTVFAEECELEVDEAEGEFRIALEEALERGRIKEEPNRQRAGEKVFVVEDEEFAYSVFPDAGMVFSCAPLD